MVRPLKSCFSPLHPGLVASKIVIVFTEEGVHRDAHQVMTGNLRLRGTNKFKRFPTLFRPEIFKVLRVLNVPTLAT